MAVEEPLTTTTLFLFFTLVLNVGTNLKALTKYFKLKASLQGLTNEPFSLLSLLEVYEVRAIGGYILAGLPIDLIDSLRIKYQIISEIGKLTIPELLTATSLENTKQLTNIYVTFTDDINLQTMNNLGNLIWFLNENKIKKVNVDAFKMHIESLEENAIRALCWNEKERNSWKELLIRVFGKPDSWSSGVLSNLGDLLFVFDSYELERINKTSRMEAADVLSRSTAFFTVVDWPGSPKPLHLYEACLEILSIPEKISFRTSVKQLLRFYLESNEFLLQTISTPENILKLNEKPNLVENALTIISPVISTHLLSHLSPSKPIPVINATEDVNNKDSFENYDYSSEEMDDHHFFNEETDDEYRDDFENDKAAVKDVEDSNGKNEDFKEEVDNHNENASHEKSLPSLFESMVKSKKFRNSKLDVSLEEIYRKRRFDKNSPKDFENDKDNSESFHTKKSKSFEEVQEELQKNASRALIVEVPLNRTDFVNFGKSSAHNIRVRKN